MRSSECYIRGELRRIVKNILTSWAKIWVFFVDDHFGFIPSIKEFFFALAILILSLRWSLFHDLLNYFLFHFRIITLIFGCILGCEFQNLGVLLYAKNIFSLYTSSCLRNSFFNLCNRVFSWEQYLNVLVFDLLVSWCK